MKKLLTNLANKFMDENPNIKINLQFQGNYRELFEKLMAAAKANQLPTMTQNIQIDYLGILKRIS